MRKPETPPVPLATLVADLGRRSPDAIARMLRRRRITGRPATTYGCPIAKMFTRDNGGQFVVGEKFIIRRIGARKVERVATPRNIRGFLHKFDLSGYSSLIAPPPRCLQPYRDRTGEYNAWRKRKAAGKLKRKVHTRLSTEVGRLGRSA